MNRPASTPPTAAAYAGPPASTPRRLRGILSLHDFEAAARQHLPRPLFGYIAGAAEDNHSLQDNTRAFDAYSFHPRVLVNVAQRSQEISLFGERYRAPFGIAPIGISALSAYRGDIALACAARDAGVPAIMSGTSLIRMEEVLDAAPGTWFQAYLPGDESGMDGLIDRVAAAGFKALVVTVDIPVWANRENNVRAGFSTPLRPSMRLALDGITHPRWLFGTFLQTLARHGMPHFENSFATRGAPMLSPRAVRDTTGRDHLDWTHLARIRRRWKGPLVVKGILHADDALRAVALGADAIVVSNHGGRQLDGAVAPLRVLPGIADAVANRIPVLLDSGIRRGSDALKALALGARCVLVGRPFMYAASIAGQAGVEHAISLLREEIGRNMAMLGVTAIDQLNASYLVPRNG